MSLESPAKPRLPPPPSHSRGPQLGGPDEFPFAAEEGLARSRNAEAAWGREDGPLLRLIQQPASTLFIGSAVLFAEFLQVLLPRVHVHLIMGVMSRVLSGYVVKCLLATSGCKRIAAPRSTASVNCCRGA